MLEGPEGPPSNKHSRGLAVPPRRMSVAYAHVLSQPIGAAQNMRYGQFIDIMDQELFMRQPSFFSRIENCFVTGQTNFEQLGLLKDNS